MRSSLIYLFILLSVVAVAPAQAVEPVRNLSEIDIEFDYKQVKKGEEGRDLITPEFQSLSTAPGTQFEQYDARIVYPMTGKGMKFDVGLNLRYIQGVASRQLDGQTNRTLLNETITALYASALFDLPFKGMSAGIEGSHTGITDQIQDYRAKLQYRWTSGLGVQGGWQHQQMSLDATDEAGSQFTSQGPFLDLNWNF